MDKKIKIFVNISPMIESLDSWKDVAAEYGLKDILKPIRKKISEVSSQKKKIHPSSRDIFRAFELTSSKISLSSVATYTSPISASLAFLKTLEIIESPLIFRSGFLGNLVAESLDGIKITVLDIIFIDKLCV